MSPENDTPGEESEEASEVTAAEYAESHRHGRLAVPGSFQGHHGRMLHCLFDDQGRVYQPHSYDVPSYPFKVLGFALNLILALIDTGIIPELWFSSWGIDRAKYRQYTRNLLERLDHAMEYLDTEDCLEYQPNEDPDIHECPACKSEEDGEIGENFGCCSTCRGARNSNLKAPFVAPGTRSLNTRLWECPRCERWWWQFNLQNHVWKKVQDAPELEAIRESLGSEESTEDCE